MSCLMDDELTHAINEARWYLKEFKGEEHIPLFLFSNILDCGGDAGAIEAKLLKERNKDG